MLASRIAAPSSLMVLHPRCAWAQLQIPALKANAKPQQRSLTTFCLRRNNHGKANRTRRRVAAGDLARRELVGGRREGNARPKGRNVVIEKKFGSPTITKDGVTVAKEIELQDGLENIGAQMVREVASKTSDVAGDGTTTATVLAQAIYREGVKTVAAGANPMAMKRGIEKAVHAICGNIDPKTGERKNGELDKFSKPVTGDMIAQVGQYLCQQRRNHWPHHRRCHEQGWQGWRHYRRRVEDP